MEHFQLIIENEDEVDNQLNTSSTKSKLYFNSSATLALIESYKNKAEDFKNTTTRNETVWQHIADVLAQQNHQYNGKQCENRIKYLLSKYKKKVDNMRNEKNSGASPVHFEYFEEMDEIFGRKPNINPKFSACSSRGFASVRNLEPSNPIDQVEANESEDEAAGGEKEPPIKRRKTMIDHIGLLRTDADEREASRNKRHMENLTSNENFISTMKTMHQDNLTAFRSGIESLVSAINKTNK